MPQQKDSPFAKRMRRVELSFNESSLLMDSESDNFGNINKQAENLRNKNNNKNLLQNNTPKLLFDCGDDVTVAGAHGKFASTLATSTPCRSVPPSEFNLFNSAETNFNFNEGENDAIFGASFTKKDDDDLPASNIFGSCLQRRLNSACTNETDNKVVDASKPIKNLETKKSCKASDLVNALPRLSIHNNSIIKDDISNDNYLETNNKENENNFAINSHKKCDENLVKSEHANEDLVCMNPWNEEERSKILKLTKAHQFMVKCHNFPNENCAKIDLNKKIDLGGELFTITKLLGQGGFAKVFQATSEENKQFAIKYEIPPCPWEVYICDALQRRLPKDFLSFVMDIRDAFIFANASAIIYDYYPCGTLLDLSNYYKKENIEMGGLIVAFFGIQLGRILEQIHAAKFIHADIKPDNIVIAMQQIPENAPIKDLINTPAIKIIDWGRSIDMFYNPEREFFGRAGTKCFDCIEMISNRPWNYQTDFFGFVATIHVLIFNDYLMTTRQNDKIRPVKQIKRRLALRVMWLDIFEQFLNIKDCKTLPSWNKVNTFMEEQLKREIKDQPLEWRKAVERFNNYIKFVTA